MMKKLIAGCVVALSILAAGTGCRSSAGVQTAHHSAGVGVGAH